MIEKPKRGPGRPPKVERKSKQLHRDQHLLFMDLWRKFQIANNQSDLAKQDGIAVLLTDILNEARGK